MCPLERMGRERLSIPRASFWSRQRVWGSSKETWGIWEIGVSRCSWKKRRKVIHGRAENAYQASSGALCTCKWSSVVNVLEDTWANNFCLPQKKMFMTLGEVFSGVILEESMRKRAPVNERDWTRQSWKPTATISCVAPWRNDPE